MAALPVPPGGTTGARQAQGVPQPQPVLQPSTLIAPIGPTIYRQGVGGTITGAGSLTSTGISIRLGSGTVSGAGALTGGGHGDGTGQVNGTGTLAATGHGLGSGTVTANGSLSGTGRNPNAAPPGGSTTVASANARPHRPSRVIRHTGIGTVTGLGVLIGDGRRLSSSPGAGLTAVGSCDAAGISLRRGTARTGAFGSTTATGYRDHHTERLRRRRLEDELFLLVDL